MVRILINYRQQLNSHASLAAWPVDFAITLSSFEPLIQGVRALIDFALTAPMHSKPPHIQYISSVGVVQSTSGLSLRRPGG